MDGKLYTMKELAEILDRDFHTTWHHIKKLGVGTMYGRTFLFTQDEVDFVVKNAKLYKKKDE